MPLLKNIFRNKFIYTFLLVLEEIIVSQRFLDSSKLFMGSSYNSPRSSLPNNIEFRDDWIFC